MATASPKGRPPMPSGEVFFNDIPNSKAYKIGLDGNVSLFVADTKHANGQAFGPDGRLYAAATGSGQILAYDADAKPTVDRRGDPRQRPCRPPRWRNIRHPTRRRWQPEPGLVHQPPGEKRVVDTGLKFANGITLSPDQSLLYVADYGSHWVYSFQVQVPMELSPTSSDSTICMRPIPPTTAGLTAYGSIVTAGCM